MRKLFYLMALIFGLLIISCSSDKEYVVRIDSMDAETRATTEKSITIEAGSDSSAFKTACSYYWAHKSTALEMNKRFEGSPAWPVPFYFSVEDKQGSVVSYSKEEAERITFDIVNYYQTKVLPKIDTITPYSKKPKEEPAKIY